MSFVLIFMALYPEFGNLRLSFLIMSTLPFALIGGIFAILVTSGVMSIASIVGFITLFGIAVKNGTIMVSHYNKLVDKGVSVRDAVVKGSLDRLGPVLMTAMTTGQALTPLAFAGNKPGNEIQAPLSIVVLGGLITSTLLVIPLMYDWLNKK